jgi:hypothetical protein
VREGKESRSRERLKAEVKNNCQVIVENEHPYSVGGSTSWIHLSGGRFSKIYQTTDAAILLLRIYLLDKLQLHKKNA